MTTTIALADDHPVVREGLKMMLGAEPDFKLVGEASNGLEAAHLAERLKPDVLVVDVMMPGLNGPQVAFQVSQRAPETRVLMLSIYANEGYVLESLRNGAAGYLLKDACAADIVHAVREVAAGRRYLSPPLSDRVIDAYIRRTESATLDLYETLTGREREVLHLAAEGHTNAVIAARLGISPRTVETHRTHLMRKLGLRSQTDLIRYALQRRLIPMDGRV